MVQGCRGQVRTLTTWYIFNMVIKPIMVQSPFVVCLRIPGIEGMLFLPQVPGGSERDPLFLVLLYRSGKTENNHQILRICAETDRPAGLCSSSDGISEIGLISTILLYLLQKHTERKNMSVFRGKKFQIVPKPSVFSSLTAGLSGIKMSWILRKRTRMIRKEGIGYGYRTAL